jgi:hypothetical protein
MRKLEIKTVINEFYKINFPLLIVIASLRIFEYCTTTIRFDLTSGIIKILAACLWFDVATWLTYSLSFFLLFALLFFISKNAAKVVLFIIYLLFIAVYVSLLITFAERTVPFDHEVFLRNAHDMLETVLSVIAVKYVYVMVLAISLAGFILLNKYVFSQIQINHKIVIGLLIIGACLFFTPRYAIPQNKNFKQFQEYYVVVNKMQYFVSDVADYLRTRKNSDFSKDNKNGIAKEIACYQQLNNQHIFVEKEYPFLHLTQIKNVLKDYFRESDTLPNVVIIIYESLSHDFSGNGASAGSFTPFLDSLSEHSLAWYNMLSNAQGTFGSAPSILGSLPFGQSGFAQQSQMPNHLTLVSILKEHNWQANYFSGSHIDYDNFGGFMRKQKVDFMSVTFPEKYKSMQVGNEDWVKYYPDDELYKYSLEVLDSIKKQPYISAYLTVTTHSPFIYFDKKKYERLFEDELKKRNIPEKQKNYLLKYKEMFGSVLFGDNALRNYFAAFKKRKDFSHTIFVITGDHHSDFFPRRNEIDLFNVPLIIYSPLLKKAQRFESVNCHFNIAPTLLSLLVGNYHLTYYPKYVSWLGDELDTCKTFRNIHHIPFMLSNRDIDNYLFEDYFIDKDELFKIKPGLELESIDDLDLIHKYKAIRENFKLVNYYSCSQNKLYPAPGNEASIKAAEFYKFEEPQEQNINEKQEFFEKIKDYKLPRNASRILVHISFDAKIDTSQLYELPLLSISLKGQTGDKELFSSVKNIYQFFNEKHRSANWLKFDDEDIINLNAKLSPDGFRISIKIWNRYLTSMKIKNLAIKFRKVE